MRRDAPEVTAPPGTPSGRGKPTTLLLSLLIFVPSYLLAIVGYLALTFIAARVLGTSDFGYFLVVLTATTLIGQISLCGVHRAGLREAARAETPEALRDLRRGVRSVLLVPLPTASVATAAGAFLWAPSDSDRLATAALSGALVFLSGYQKVGADFLRGLGHVRASSLLTGRSGGALVALTQALCVVLIWWLAPGAGLAEVLAGTAAGYVLPLLWAGRLLRRSWPKVGPTRMWADLKQVIRRDWRFTASQTGGFLNATVELWLAAAVLSAVATSFFGASQRVSQLLLIPASSIQIVFSPAIARLAKRDEHRHMEPLLRTAATVSTGASAVLWIPLMLVPGLVLLVVFGEGFSAAAPALMLLASANLLNSASGISATALSMTAHEGDVAVLTWCAVGLRLVSGTVCASLWGVTGLAASSVAITLLYYAATWLAVRRRLSISPHLTMHPRLSLLTRISG